MAQLSNAPVIISIVEDDESVRTAMKEMVESFGYPVAAFSSAAEFLASQLLNDSACLITDVRMPGISGLDLHDQLIASGYLIPTIFVTAFPDERDWSRAMKSGAIAYLAKPCRRDDVLAHLKSVLVRRDGSES
jgi:FixJ family two-component response regulator